MADGKRLLRSMRMIKILIILILATLFMGCSTKDETFSDTAADSLSTQQDSIVTLKDVLVSQNSRSVHGSGFNVKKFVNFADSLLTRIRQKPISITYKIDTMGNELTKEFSPFNALNQSPFAVVVRYSFDPGKGNRHLRMGLVDATYPNSTTTEKAFHELLRRTGKVNDNFDYAPGLTYSNDYVVKTATRIFWLNTGCSYAFFQHRKLSRLMLRSIHEHHVQDSIHCECGQPECHL